MNTSTQDEYTDILTKLNTLKDIEIKKLFFAIQFLYQIQAMKGFEDKVFTPVELNKIVEKKLECDTEPQLNKNSKNEEHTTISIFFMDELINSITDARHIVNVISEAAEYAGRAGETIDGTSTHRTLWQALTLLTDSKNKVDALWEEYQKLSTLISNNSTTNTL